MDIYEKAILIIESVNSEIELGTIHYRQSTMKKLNSNREILEALLDNDLIIKPTPERRHLFGRGKSWK